MDNATAKKNYQLYLAKPEIGYHRVFGAHTTKQLEILKNSQTPETISLRQQLEKYRHLPESQQIAEVSHYINHSIQYLPHAQHPPQPSGWGDVECILATGGDCADYAQTKYLALRYLGWPDERLHMVIGWGWNSGTKILHAVLLVTQNDQSQLVLDNRHGLPRPPLESTDFEPLYAFNAKQNFVFVASKSAEPDIKTAPASGTPTP